MSKKGLGNVQFAGKVKTQTFKQFQLERLIKDGTVIPASKLAESKEQELQRIRDFEAAAVDEQRHNKSTTPASEDKIENRALTGERFDPRGIYWGIQIKKAPKGLFYISTWRRREDSNLRSEF